MSAAGRQDDQRLVGEVSQGGRLPRRRWPGRTRRSCCERCLRSPSWRLPRRGIAAAGRWRPTWRTAGPDPAEPNSTANAETRPTTSYDVRSPGDATAGCPRGRRGGIEQRHAGDLVGVAGGEREHVEPAEGMARQHVRSGNLAALQQRVQVGRDLQAVLRSVRGLAPSTTRTVVDADPGVSGYRRSDPPETRGHRRRRPARAPPWDCPIRCSSGAGGARPRRSTDRASGRPGRPSLHARSRSRRRSRRAPTPRSQGRAASARPGYEAADGHGRSSRSPTPA